MSNGRCKATHAHGGSIYRCQDIEGHTSAHYYDDLWWENDKGLPKHFGPGPCGCVMTAWLVAAAVFAGAVIYWLMTR
jgi:hypothetical protein